MGMSSTSKLSANTKLFKIKNLNPIIFDSIL